MSNISTGSAGVFRNAWSITKRDMLHWKQNPSAVLIGWAFPIMVLLLFGTLFGGAIQVPTGTSYYDFLVPGMLVMAVLFGIEATLTAVTSDAAKGVTDRFRSMPISSSAVVLGRCIADTLNSVIGLALVAGVGLALGWRWHDGLSGFLAGVGLLLLLRFAILWMGIFIGLLSKGPESVVGAQILVWPIGFFSSVFVNPTTMPAWIAWLADWNPVSATATAIRELFGNSAFTHTTWASEHAIFLAILWPLLITAIFMPLSVRAYRNLKN